jgi:raffinose/stachyose/melibiose transport system permease protein
MSTYLRERISNHKNAGLMLFVFPALAFLLVFIAYPFVRGVVYAFTDWSMLSTSYNYIGIDNFINMFKDTAFVSSINFTLKYAVLSIILQNVGAILLAIILDKVIRLKGFLRGVFFLPNVLAQVVVAFTWTFVFTKGFEGLYSIVKLPFLNWSWFGSANLAFLAIVTTTLWTGVGYLMIIYTAGLQQMDQTYIEASLIDGANWFQQLIRIKLPLLMPSIVVGVFTVTMGSIKQFDISFILTQGGPYRSTESLALNVYNQAYSSYNNGLACAQAIFMLVVILAITFCEVHFLKRKEIEA